MSYAENPATCWDRLDSLRSALISRCERYAALTIPKVCLPSGFDVISNDQTHDYQSLGAEAVNNVVNKLMLALFPPGHPFFIMKLEREAMQQAIATGLTETQVADVLAEGEREAVTTLEASGQRPRVYNALRHLVVTGNVLVDKFSSKGELKVTGIRNFCVTRTGNGKIKTLVVREKLLFGELEPKVQELMAGRYNDDSEVVHYKRIRRLRNGDYVLDQSIDTNLLPNDRFGGKWTEKTLPFAVWTWDLDDESDYATGLIEEHVGDFEALSILSESSVDGGVMAAEVRYLVNNTGQTNADDMNKSENGDFVPGNDGDVVPVTAENYNGVRVAFEIMSRWEQRIARNFLMTSAITRNAERVTAEEIRMNAQELETAYGGRYSALGATVQPFIAEWLLDKAGFSLKGTKVRIVIITGLDALSRNAEIESLKLAMGDLAAVATLPPELQDRIKMDDLAMFVGQGRGTDLKRFLLSDQEYEQKVAKRQAAQVNTEAAVAGAQAGAQGALAQ